MTTMLRVFIKPDGHLWMDMALADGQNAATVFIAAAREGCIVCPDWWVPMDAVLFTATWQLVDQALPKPTVVPFKQPEVPAWASTTKPPPPVCPEPDKPA
jgi:hypothetical protein